MIKCDVIEQCAENCFHGKRIVHCPNNFDSCFISADKRPEIVCQENRKKYTLLNTEGKVILHYLVDGGIICDESRREESSCKCDHLFLEGSREAAILIELKGKNICKALEQIYNTIQSYQTYLNGYTCVFARIVMANGSMAYRTSSQYRKLDKLVRKLRGNIKLKENNFKEKYTDLCEMR